MTQDQTIRLSGTSAKRLLSHFKDAVLLQARFFSHPAAVIWMVMMISTSLLEPLVPKSPLSVDIALSIFGISLNLLAFFICLLTFHAIYHNQTLTLQSLWQKIKHGLKRYAVTTAYSLVWHILYALIPLIGTAIWIYNISDLTFGQLFAGILAKDSLPVTISVLIFFYLAIHSRLLPIFFAAVLEHPQAPLKKIRIIGAMAMDGKKTRFSIGFIILTAVIWGALFVIYTSAPETLYSIAFSVLFVLLATYEYIFFQKEVLPDFDINQPLPPGVPLFS